MQKKLYRSPKDGIVLGVAAGLGHFFEKDPVLVRLIFVILALVTKFWPALLVYGLMFIIIPVDPAQQKVNENQEPKDVTSESPEEEKKETNESEDEEKEVASSPAEEPKEETPQTEEETPAPVERMDSDRNM